MTDEIEDAQPTNDIMNNREAFLAEEAGVVETGDFKLEDNDVDKVSGYPTRGDVAWDKVDALNNLNRFAIPFSTIEEVIAAADTLRRWLTTPDEPGEQGTSGL